MKNILALSSSRAGNGAYLENASILIEQFLGRQNMKIGFIPFASVERDYEQYGMMVKQALAHLPYQVLVLNEQNVMSSLETIEVVMVGGGNTFKLLHDLYEFKLLEVIRNLVNSGIPYVGWSAGANITGFTIGTTNDMPIIQPQSFTALKFFPFQINPHYLNHKPEGFHGETRDQRLEEFVKLNPGVPVVGLPEGSALNLSNGNLQYLSNIPGVIFTSDDQGLPVRRKIIPGHDLSYLLSEEEKRRD